MASLTLSISDELKKDLKKFMWVNWSEIAREETRKKIIFEKFLKEREISPEDWNFCEKINWHPVDELPMKKEHLNRLKKIKKGKFKRYNNVDDLFSKL